MKTAAVKSAAGAKGSGGMRGWLTEWKYGGAVCVSAALLWLVCLAAPAGAFWGDYGPEPPPEIFGVRLGDDIRNYEGMEMSSGPYEPDSWNVYQRKADEGVTFEGVPLVAEGPDSRPYYKTYKNKIYCISFHVSEKDYEKVAQRLNAMFGPPREQRESPIGGRFEYIWMNSETFVRSHRNGGFYIYWLPIQKKFYGEHAVKWSKPVAFEGVLLGGKVEDYPFLKEIYREGVDVIFYTSEKSLPYRLDSCIFSAYKGKIYGFTFSFNNDRLGYHAEMYYALDMLGLPDDADKYFHFWGDVQVDWLRSETVYIRLTPIYWEANRARIVYYRNIKID